MNEISSYLTPNISEVAWALLVVAVLICPLEYMFRAHPLRLTRKAFGVDLSYWFFTPVVTRTITNTIIGLCAFPLLHLSGKSFEEYLFEGWGWVGTQPLWLQAVELLLMADFIDYWSHRLFHSRGFWRFHAIHHSPQQFYSIGSARMHPVNDAVTRCLQVLPLLSLGFAAVAVIAIVPYLFFYVIFVHSNIDADFGWFRYVLVSPNYHRWHHSSDDEAVDKNFSGIFPVWDLMFGTCHFPRRQPRAFGLRHQELEESFLAQLRYPLRRKRKRSPRPGPKPGTCRGENVDTLH